MAKIFRPEWRTQSRAKRRFYARYMGWLERVGFVVTLLLIAAFAYSFYWQTEDWVSADDVPIEASVVEAAGLVASSELYLEEILVESGQDVAEGEPLATGYLGVDASYRESLRAIERVEEESSDPSERSRLAAVRQAIPVPKAITFRAASAGTVRIPDGVSPGRHPKGTIVVEILDYSRLVVKANLSGRSVSQAAEGQPAKLTQLKLHPESGTLLRGRLDSKDFLSRNVITDAFKTALEDALKGRSVVASQDIPLSVEGVDSVEVEGTLRALNGKAESEPLPEYTLDGQVDGGHHLLSAQAGALPRDLYERIRAQLQEEVSKSSLAFEGDPQVVVKLKAGGQAPQSEGIPVASLKRTFEAEITITDPPRDIVARIKEAHRRSMTATAKVQVRTGTRSLASLLLRRS